MGNKFCKNCRQYFDVSGFYDHEPHCEIKPMTPHEKALEAANNAYSDSYDYERIVSMVIRAYLKSLLTNPDVVELVTKDIGLTFVLDGIWNIQEGWKIEKATKAALATLLQIAEGK